MSSAQPLLQLKNLSVKYGAIQALHKVSFDVFSGEIVSLIGANGAGKTTVLRAISGLIPAEGEILFKGEDLKKVDASDIVKLGIAHAPEGRGIFLNLTVEENLDLGAWSAKNRKTLSHDMEQAYSVFPKLKERRKQSAGTLSGGEQQMLAIVRALMAHPELLLLDEPSLGLAPQVIEKIFETIQRINGEGMTVLLVEQNAYQALSIANRGIVLETGTTSLSGQAADLLRSPQVKEAYLGLSAY